MKKALFIDRDGTILIEPQDKQIDTLEKMEFVPGVIVTLHRIARELDYELVLVSNQDGLGTASFPEETYWPVQNKMLKILENEGIHFAEILVDRSLPHENKPTRKPGTAMLKNYLNGDYDLKNSYVIGDRETDVQLAANMGANAIAFGDKAHPQAVLVTKKWDDVYHFLRFPPRKVSVSRNTSETKIEITLNLDGNGKSDISSGVGFFDHMLDLFARHAGCDLAVKVHGDLHVDEHHTMEDTALALGEAFKKALGDKRGVNRYGFLLPMDESLARVAIDFSGRSELVWKARFKREMIGDLPTEMFAHFFKSFSQSAGCNLHIKATGNNEHHKIEAIFKAVARAIRTAVKRDADSDEIPSTKGVL